MRKPTYEEQNKFLESYVAPITLDADVEQVIENIKENSKEAKWKREYYAKRLDDENFLKESEKAGVFISLASMDIRDCSSFEKLMSKMRHKIKGTEEYEADQIDKKLFNYKFIGPESLIKLFNYKFIGPESLIKLFNYKFIGPESLPDCFKIYFNHLGKEDNRPCPCGSGKPADRCCIKEDK
ncbi:MAG: SEC-C domain-containing protein [Candidatus Pacearchaeota archaeon]|nr:MAG: SEC-C domain-containing protein [Candidatus Pacearchaeota archaeon]